MRSLWGVAAAGVLCAVPAAAAARQQHQIDLPAGSLQQAVIALGRQAGISIAVTDPSLLRIRVPAVRGRMGVDEALRRMLGGTGARAVTVAGGSYRVVRAPVPKRRADPPRTVPQAPPPEPVDNRPIIVTATKRALPLRDYPGPATIVDGDAFAAGGAAGGTDSISERVPSLSSTHLGPGRDKLFIRAIADSSFTGQTQSTVGHYFGEARINYNAPDPALRLYDITAVEILPGPQGTLYGAGAMGGVLRLVPHAPNPSRTRFGLSGSLALTRHGAPSSEIAGFANLPLIADRAALRLVGYHVSEGGYIDDIRRDRSDINRTRIVGGRASALAELAPGWSIEGGAVVQSIDGRDGQYADRALGDLERAAPVAQPFSNDYLLGYATLRGTIGANELVSTVSAARHDLVEDFDRSLEPDAPSLFRQRNRPTLLVSETRLSRTRADGLGWLAGVQILRSRSRLDRSEGEPGKLEPLTGVKSAIDEQTLFGEISHPLSERLTLTAGLRLSHVEYRGKATGVYDPLDRPSDGGDEWRLLPSLAAGFEPKPDLTLYLRYQEGFRPGGLIVRSNATQKLDPDHLAAGEVGLRFGQQRQSRFSGALSVSYSRWRDVQADTIDTVGLPTTLNLGDGTIVSLDGKLGWRVSDRLDLSLAATWNRSRVTNSKPGIIIVDRAPLPNVPDAKVRAGVDYRQPAGKAGTLTLSGWVNYVGKSTLGIGPILGREQGDYLDSGIEARLGSGRRFLFLRATNLFDTVGNRFALGSVLSIIFEDQITPLRPRTIRLGGHVTF